MGGRCAAIILRNGDLLEASTPHDPFVSVWRQKSCATMDSPKEYDLLFVQVCVQLLETLPGLLLSPFVS